MTMDTGKQRKRRKPRESSSDLDGGKSVETESWRRRRDSNPRYGNTPYGGLANRWFQPLTHVSSGGSRGAAIVADFPTFNLNGQTRITLIRRSRAIASPGSSTFSSGLWHLRNIGR